MTFHVGQKVVCVNVRGLERHFYPRTRLPVERVTYTVRELLTIKGKPLLRLHEIVNHEYDFESGVFEPAFHVSRFRPITERKTDISIFKKLLQPNSKIIERV